MHVPVRLTPNSAVRDLGYLAVSSPKKFTRHHRPDQAVTLTDEDEDEETSTLALAGGLAPPISFALLFKAI